MRWGLKPFKNLSLMVLQEFLGRKFEGKFCGAHGFQRRCHYSAKGRLISAFVNDHYGDILWKLNRKIQARYFWNNVLSFDDTDEDIRKNINIKIIEGLKNS